MYICNNKILSFSTPCLFIALFLTQSTRHEPSPNRRPVQLETINQLEHQFDRDRYRSQSAMKWRWTFIWTEEKWRCGWRWSVHASFFLELMIINKQATHLTFFKQHVMQLCRLSTKIIRQKLRIRLHNAIVILFLYALLVIQVINSLNGIAFWGWKSLFLINSR